MGFVMLYDPQRGAVQVDDPVSQGEDMILVAGQEDGGGQGPQPGHDPGGALGGHPGKGLISRYSLPPRARHRASANRRHMPPDRAAG